jgi:hypothetical protein
MSNFVLSHLFLMRLLLVGLMLGFAVAFDAAVRFASGVIHALRTAAHFRPVVHSPSR